MVIFSFWNISKIAKKMHNVYHFTIDLMSDDLVLRSMSEFRES